MNVRAVLVVPLDLLVGGGLVGVLSMTGTVHVSLETALAVNDVLDGADGTIGLVENVLAFGLLTIAVFLV